MTRLGFRLVERFLFVQLKIYLLHQFFLVRPFRRNSGISRCPRLEAAQTLISSVLPALFLIMFFHFFNKLVFLLQGCALGLGFRRFLRHLPGKR